MELFKKEFYEDLSKITIHKTLNNVAINISEAGFKAMKDDPEYREKILSLLKRDLGSSLARNCSAVFTVGATIKEYRGDSWPVGYDSEFYARSQDSFFKKASEKKDRQKELLEEYMEKRTQAKRQQQERLDEKIAKAERERSGLARAWSSKQQMAKASDAYAVNVIVGRHFKWSGDCTVAANKNLPIKAVTHTACGKKRHAFFLHRTGKAV